MCTHSRSRYRLIAKNPTVNAAPPDPNLWLVHYRPAEQQNQIPANHVPVAPAVNTLLNERRWIESQGRLERKEFMLHDREHWPQLNFGRGGPAAGPGGQMYTQHMYGSQNPMAHLGNPRFSGQFYQQGNHGPAGMVGPSPAKRQRQHPPSTMPGAAAATMATQDTSIEDEENTQLGDMLDHLTPRDLSITRYQQHHEWMEEVFSSPYATGQIVPVDLGFGLMGELAGLTKGLLDLPTPTERDSTAVAKRGEEAKFKKVTPEQLEEFEKRVNKHLEEGQKELERMKAEHAKKMEELSRSKTLTVAEKRLRSAPWDLEDVGNEFWRLDRLAPTANDSPKENVDDIRNEVEKLLGVTIEPQKEATMVERGGLKEKAPQPQAPASQTDGAESGSGGEMNAMFDQAQNDEYAGVYASTEMSAQPSSTGQAPQQPQQPQQSSVPQAAAQPQPEVNADTAMSMDNLDNLGTMEESQFDIEGMDIDVDSANLQFGGTPGQGHTPKPDPAKPSYTNPTTQHLPSANTVQQSTETAPQDVAAAGQRQPQQAPSQGENTPGMFGDFDAGDGLIDFEGGDNGGLDLGLDMDNSAFGDAFHGTDLGGNGEESNGS